MDLQWGWGHLRDLLRASLKSVAPCCLSPINGWSSTGNRNLGIRLGQGEKLEDILSSSTEVSRPCSDRDQLTFAWEGGGGIRYSALPSGIPSDQGATSSTFSSTLLTLTTCQMPRSFRMDLKFPILFGVAEVNIFLFLPSSSSISLHFPSCFQHPS